MIVASIGLGMMGSAMASRLVATGHHVVVHDIDRAAAERIEGAEVASSAAAAAADADVVSICVPAATHVGIVLGEIVPVLGSAATVLIHSTIAPEDIRRFATDVGVRGATLVDACVAGGADAAAVGQLIVFVGALDGLSHAARSVLDAYGSALIDAGPVGSGAALKLAVNVMTYAQFAAVSTARDLVVTAGADVDALMNAWRHVGMLGALTERFAGLLAVPAEHLDGLAPMLRTQAGIARKDLALAAGLDGVDDARHEWLDALSAAMTDVYRVGPDPEEDDR